MFAEGQAPGADYHRRVLSRSLEALYLLLRIAHSRTLTSDGWASAVGKAVRFAMLESPGDLFNSTFTQAAVQPLVAALKRAYLTASELHDPERGSNETTFGFNLYQFAVHELRKAAGATNTPLRIISSGPIFRLAIGEFELACHRVGRNARQDIHSSLPNNDGAACTMVEQQLWLAGMAEVFDLPKARKLVIAHLGNPDDGLGAIYLCIAGRADGERITSWAYTHQIWHADSEDAIAPTSVPTSDKPADEVIPQPTVRKKPRKDRKNPPKDKSEEET